MSSLDDEAQQLQRHCGSVFIEYDEDEYCDPFYLGSFEVGELRTLPHIKNIGDATKEHPFRVGLNAVAERGTPNSLPWENLKTLTQHEGGGTKICGINAKRVANTWAKFRVNIAGGQSKQIHLELLDAVYLRGRAGAVEAGNWVRLRNDGYNTEYGRAIVILREVDSEPPTMWLPNKGERLFVLVLRLSSSSLPLSPWHIRARDLQSKMPREYNEGACLVTNISAVEAVTASVVAEAYWPSDSAVAAAANLESWAKARERANEIVEFMSTATLDDENLCSLFAGKPKRRSLMPAGPNSGSGGQQKRQGSDTGRAVGKQPRQLQSGRAVPTLSIAELMSKGRLATALADDGDEALLSATGDVLGESGSLGMIASAGTDKDAKSVSTENSEYLKTP